MKNYEVSITAFATVIVIAAKDADEACQLACEQINMGDLELDAGETLGEVPDNRVANARRHAQFVVEAE